MKMSMGEFLATLRKANGYTQQEVAEKLDVSNRTLSSWETDRTAPDILILPAIADLYGVTVDEILRCERKTAEAEPALSDNAKRNLKKRRYAKWGVKRLFCLGFGLLGSLIFLAGCAVLLYSSLLYYAPFWLPVVLMVIGAGGALACVVLLACFAYSSVRAEGIVLKEDYTEENKPYALCVRRGVAVSLFWLSLAYISGAIIFLIVFFAAGYCFYSYYYITITVTLICINAAFALTFFIAGLILNLAGIFKLGTGVQRAAVKSNGKLLCKIAGFSSIPIAIALILFAVFYTIVFDNTLEVYFTAHSEEEIYGYFQTFETGGIYEVDTDGSSNTILPEGDYFLNFQSEDYVELGLYHDLGDIVSGKFYDLGGGFYMCEERTHYGFATDHIWWENYETSVVWKVYYLYGGVTAEDLKQGGFYSDYLTWVTDATQEIWFDLPAPDYGLGCAYNVEHRDFLPAVSSGWDYEHEAPIYRRYVRSLNYYEDAGEWRYELIRYSDYSLVFLIVLCSVAGATAIAGTAAYFIKRKRTEYKF